MRPAAFADCLSRPFTAGDDVTVLLIFLLSLSQSSRTRAMQSIARSVSVFPRGAAGIRFFIPRQRFVALQSAAAFACETCEQSATRLAAARQYCQRANGCNHNCPSQQRAPVYSEPITCIHGGLLCARGESSPAAAGRRCGRGDLDREFNPLGPSCRDRSPQIPSAMQTQRRGQITDKRRHQCESSQINYSYVRYETHFRQVYLPRNVHNAP